MLKNFPIVMLAVIGFFFQASAEVVPPATLLPLSKASYYHFAKDQNLNDLIRDFFAMQGVTVIISDKVNHTVNGRFNKMDPADFWTYLTKAYGLAWFFDGKIMYVYSSSELHTQILRMDVDGVGTLATILSRLGFVASDFSFREVGEANVLIVTAPPQYLNVINDISSKFVPSKISDTTIVKVIPLKYAWAYDMTFNYANGSILVPGVATLLQNIVTGQQSSGGFSQFNVSVGGSSKQVQYQNMLGILDDTPQYAKDINNKLDKSQSKDKDASSKENAGDESNVADISGSTLPGFITCDQRLNAIIIRDKRENMPFYEDIISKLDVSSEVIKIDVAVVNVSSVDAFSLGLSGISVANEKQVGENKDNKWAGASSNIGSMAELGKTTLKEAVGSIAGNLGVISNVKINFALDALQKTGDGQTISKPSVLTLDNVAAILETERTQYSTVVGANNSNAYSQTATTKLQVVPHIIPNDVDENGKRKMKLFVDISEGDFEQVDQGSDPRIVQHSLNTQSVLYEGQSLMIGGYNAEKHSKSNGGIPILKDLPIVGMLFRHSSHDKEIKERIYVISPTIVEIRSDDHKYERFLQKGKLTAKASLDSEEFPLPVKWPKQEKPKVKTLGRR